MDEGDRSLRLVTCQFSAGGRNITLYIREGRLKFSDFTASTDVVDDKDEK